MAPPARPATQPPRVAGHTIHFSSKTRSSIGRGICGTRCRAYEVLGFNTAAGGDEVFRDLVLARIIEPTSKADSLRVLDETGMAAPFVSDAEPSIAGIRQTRFPASTLVFLR